MTSYQADEAVKWAWLFGLILTSAVMVPFVIALIAGGVEQPVLAVLFVLTLLMMWGLFLTTGTRIEIDDSGTVTCEAPVSTRRFMAAEVTAVRGWRFLMPHVVTISYGRGSVRILGRMTGLSSLIDELRKASPGALIRGV